MSYTNYLQIPFKHLGRNFKGCDCLGLVRLYYYTEFNIDLPDYQDYETSWYLKDALRITRMYKDFGFEKVSTPQYGDILLLNESGYPKHLAVTLENGYLLHTTESGTCCCTYLQGPYSQNIHSIFRYTQGLTCK